VMQRNYKMVDMREVEVAQAVTLIQQGWTYHQIASDSCYSVSVVYRAVKGYRESGHGGKYCSQMNQDSRWTITCLEMYEEHLNEPNILEINKFGGGSILVWATIRVDEYTSSQHSRLVRSMSRRYQAVIHVHGGHTRY
ncbi:hypothetical protein ANN_02485, partial [Periplaneta americana]